MKVFKRLFHLSLIILLCASSIEAKKVLSEQDLLERMKDDKIYKISLVDAGLGGLEKNEFGLPTEEFIVIGQYDKIPRDISDIAQKKNVEIGPSQRFNDMNRSGTYNTYLPIAMFIFNLLIIVGAFSILIMINNKLSEILKILRHK